MDWTETKPREEGHYWYTGEHFRAGYDLPETLLVRIEHVFDPPSPLAEGRFMVPAPDIAESVHVDEVDGLWAGPLDLRPPPLP